MKGKQKKLMLRIILILIAILIVGTFAPFYTSNAEGEEDNFVAAVFKDQFEIFFNAFARFLADIADIVIGALQEFFIGTDEMCAQVISIDTNNDIKQIESNDNYKIKYSPGIIFSGKVPAFDINFIKGGTTSISNKKNEIDVIVSWDIDKIRENATQQRYYRYFEADGNGYYQKERGDGTLNTDNSIAQEFTKLLKDCGFERGEVAIRETSDNLRKKNYYVWNYQGSIYVYYQNKNEQTAADYDYYLYKMNLSPEIIEEIKIQTEQSETIVIQSSAKILQKTISTWYNVMKTIAVVGLLSVLVYVAIRMIISSSLEDKAKYKKMLGDWLAALCLIYLLHYFMALTLTILEAICNVFQPSTIGEYGHDVLMSSIRTEIEHGTNFTKQFANIIIYLVLVILTGVFTYQYLKRFIYAAFLTMIAPLIALTYPLDKIKDGKAQAYTTWLREYLFTVLIQAVHLIVYMLLLGTTKDLMDVNNLETYNPVYAIAAISFIIPAEKFIRNMFGFNKTEAANTIGSALGGAAIMNGINKLGKKTPQPPKEAEGEKNTKVRTANEGKDPYSGLKGEKTESGGQQEQETKRSIKKGLGNVAKKYVFNKKTAKGLLKTGGRLTGAATLGTVGLAAGIATGEPENALAGAVGGIAAGNRVGGNLVDGGANLINSVSGGITGIGDTYKEGKYGKDEYARMKFDKEFKKTAEYKDFIKKHKGREDDVQEFLNAGITDLKMMNKAMEKNYDIKDAIGYIKMAQATDCPNEVLYDREKFKTYLASRGIPESEAERIRKGIVTFK